MHLDGFCWALNLGLEVSPRALLEISVLLKAADDCIFGRRRDGIRAKCILVSSVGNGKRASWGSG